MSVKQFDREQWVRDLVTYGLLTKRQAEVVVRIRAGGSVGKIAGDFGIDQITVRAHWKNAMSVMRRDRTTYLLLIGPAEFYRNRDDYPNVNETLEFMLNPPDEVDQISIHNSSASA